MLCLVGYRGYIWPVAVWWAVGPRGAVVAPPLAPRAPRQPPGCIRAAVGGCRRYNRWLVVFGLSGRYSRSGDWQPLRVVVGGEMQYYAKMAS